MPASTIATAAAAPSDSTLGGPDRGTLALGATAVRTLLERIENPGGPVHTIVLPTTFVDRGSIGPPPAR